MEQEEFRDLAVNNQAELERIKSGAMASPLVQRGSRADGARAADVDDLQHRCALDRDGDSHHDLYPGLRAHGRGDELVAGALDDLARQPARPRPHAPERPCWHQVRYSFPRLRQGLFRGEGGQLRGDGAGARSLRLVRDTDLDRGPRPRRADDRGLGRVGQRTWTLFHNLLRVLGDTARDHPSRRRGREGLRVVRGPPASGRQPRAARLGILRGRRHCQRVRDLGEAAAGRRAFLGSLLAVAGGERGVLDHALPQHPGLHPLREDPALAGPGTGARASAHDDGLFLHRDRGNGGDHRRLRRGDLGPGGAHHQAG